MNSLSKPKLERRDCYSCMSYLFFLFSFLCFLSYFLGNIPLPFPFPPPPPPPHKRHCYLSNKHFTVLVKAILTRWNQQRPWQKKSCITQQLVIMILFIWVRWGLFIVIIMLLGIFKMMPTNLWELWTAKQSFPFLKSLFARHQGLV